MSDTPEKPVRVFYRDPSEAQLYLKNHNQITERVNEVVYILEHSKEPDSTLAARTRELVNTEKCLLWTVDDHGKIEGFAFAALLSPEAESNAIIPAIVVNAGLKVWQHPIETLPKPALAALVEAILELPSLYESATLSKKKNLVEEEEFVRILGQGDPSRHQIIPASRLRRRIS